MLDDDAVYCTECGNELFPWEDGPICDECAADYTDDQRLLAEMRFGVDSYR
jgi:hypothetical protein